MTSTGRIVSVPYASAAMACAPPMRYTSVTPASAAAANVGGGTTGDVAPGAGDGDRELPQHDAVTCERRCGRVELRGVVLADAIRGDLQRSALPGHGRVERRSQL